MSNDKAIQETGKADVWIDKETTGRVLESIVTRGDISALNPEERARYYLQICDSLGLTPATLPFLVLRLNGKEIMYATRSATDQLAAIHRINRRIIDGPRLIDLGGTKLIYAVCEATHPNGRIETSVATVPFTDPANVLMKAETKSKRRATLSILGLAMLSEDEVDDIPAKDKQPTRQVQVSLEQPASAELPDPSKTPALDALNADLDALDERGVSLLEACRVWLKHKDAIGAECRGDSEYMFTAQRAVLGALKVSAAANQLNEHVQILEMRAKTPEGGTYPTVLDLLALADIGSDVVQIWKDNSESILERSAEIQLLLKKAATRRVQEIEPGLEDVRKAGQWLKSQLSPKDKPPTPPNGGTKPEAPTIDVDPERAAIASQDDATAPQAVASEATGDVLPATALRNKLAECTVHQHLLNALLKYGPGTVPQDEAVQIAAERMQALGANYLTAAKAIRDEIDRRGGWKQSRKAA